MALSDDLPRRRARTGGFRRGQPRSAVAFGGPDDWRVRYLASDGPFDPVLSLRELDSLGRSGVLADPAVLLADDEDLPAAERARRERLRESGAGTTAFSSDRDGERSAFVLSGRLWVVGSEPRGYDVVGAVDPQVSPDGSRVACHADGDLVVVDVASGSASTLASGGLDVTVGLADFIAAEEMGRMHGLWWSPDSDRLLFTRVDEGPVVTWWLGDPARPEAAPRTVRYPAAGTPNADVRLFITDLSGEHIEVRWDRQRYPYLAAVRWQREGALVSVQARDQRAVLHLLVESDGATREVDRQEHAPWVELVPGSPRLDPEGRLVVVAVDPDTDAWRVRVGREWVTPPELYVRSVLRCDDDGLWLTGSRDPRENHLYRLAHGRLEQLTPEGGWHSTLAAGPVPVVAVAREDAWQPEIVVSDPRHPAARLPDVALAPHGLPRPIYLPPAGAVRVSVVLPPTRAGAGDRVVLWRSTRPAGRAGAAIPGHGAMVRGQRLRGRGHRRPGHAWRVTRLRGRHRRRPGGSGARGPDRRAAGRASRVPEPPRPEPGGDPGLVVWRVSRGAGGAARA